MSAPHTDVERQEKRHRFPLMGMGGVVLFAILLLVLWIAWLALAGNDPDTAEQQIDGRTGAVEMQEDGAAAAVDTDGE
ncbi:hypothetical protein EKE94_07800 [Mesobaculum littorinae]|uniref:Uncharacterized protein n=1 Tax=Mesobaculum littorinae TaxID=2486419 RepID=A0A438AJ50_9RHOB|nr:hypothetical protein [Mesobaculum littorinae]RVV98793.1 hypothetical protein EKE94_07800 [Mesobaculum littorinae]